MNGSLQPDQGKVRRRQRQRGSLELAPPRQQRVLRLARPAAAAAAAGGELRDGDQLRLHKGQLQVVLRAAAGAPRSALERSLTPVYSSTGSPSAPSAAHPQKQPSASGPPGEGTSAGGRWCHVTMSSETAWPQTMPKSQVQPSARCW